MTDETKPKIENLELNRETIQDLTEQQSEEAQGGILTTEITLTCAPSNFPTFCIVCKKTYDCSMLCTDHCR